MEIQRMARGILEKKQEQKIRGLLHILVDFKIFYKVTIEYGIGVYMDKKYRSREQQRAQKYTHPCVTK